jgi:hypothetical protein
MRTVTVKIEPLAKEKIFAFAKAVKTEIGGLLSVRQEGRTLIVSDAWTVPQEVTGGSVDFEVGHFEDHIRAMGWINGKPMPYTCMGIWHSHVDFGVGMSSIDEHDLVRKYAMRGFLVNVVVNRKDQLHVEVDSMVGPENGKPEDYILVTVPNTITWGYSPMVLDFVTREIEANVKEKKADIIVQDQGDLDFSHWDRNYRRAKEYGKPVKDYKTAYREKDKGFIWTYDKATRSLIQSNSKGKIIKQATKGEIKLFDDDGKMLFKTNDRTAIGPRASKNLKGGRNGKP